MRTHIQFFTHLSEDYPVLVASDAVGTCVSCLPRHLFCAMTPTHTLWSHQHEKVPLQINVVIHIFLMFAF